MSSPSAPPTSAAPTEPDAPISEVPETPRSVVLPEPRSSVQIIEVRPVEGEEGATLLSAPQPASSFELETEDRLGRLERELLLLRSRLESMESEQRLAAERAKQAPGEATPRISPKLRMVLFWAALLLLMAAYGLMKS
ncbi:MAG: hypothetical protein KIT72_14380 [Polyangiaceae bacterium]|nr:hypothetical protein [Polyangiaceae bacterium]MCW5791600.1 hypothetical protein [Polyangiaceae bacterium]